MRNDKQRLFEVMGRLDKTFTAPKLNEGFEEIEATDNVEMPAEVGSEEMPAEEKSPEEKLAELTAKVDEMHAMLHGEAEGEEELPAEEPVEMGMETGEIEVENLQEWNFDKKKGEEHEEKSEDKKEDEKEEKEEKEEVDESEEPAKKVPVEAIAKVGK